MGCGSVKDHDSLKLVKLYPQAGANDFEDELFRKPSKLLNLTSISKQKSKNMLLRCAQSRRDAPSQLLLDSNIDSEDENIQGDFIDLSQIPSISFPSLQARSSVSLKLEKTGIPEIDIIIDESAFPMFTLESAYNSVVRCIQVFSQATYSEGEEVYFSVMAMLVIYSVYLKGKISALNLTVCESLPYLKYNESYIKEELGDSIPKAWNKLLSVLRQIKGLLPSLSGELEKVEQKKPEINRFASEAHGRSLETVKTNLNLFSNAVSLHQLLEETIDTILKNLEGVKSVVQNANFSTWLERIGKESIEYSIKSNADIASYYWNEIRALNIKIVPKNEDKMLTVNVRDENRLKMPIKAVKTRNKTPLLQNRRKSAFKVKYQRMLSVNNQLLRKFTSLGNKISFNPLSKTLKRGYIKLIEQQSTGVLAELNNRKLSKSGSFKIGLHNGDIKENRGFLYSTLK